MHIIDSISSTPSPSARRANSRAFVRQLQLVTCLAASGLGALACGAAQEAESGGDSTQIEGEEIELDAQELSQYLTDDENTCGSATADKKFTSVFSTFTSTDTYEAGRNDCWGAYFVDVKDYRTGDTASNYNRIDWGGSALDTQAKCEAANLRAYVFERVTGGVTFVDAVNLRGKWSSGEPCGNECIPLPRGCTLGINVDPAIVGGAGKFKLTPGKSYKFALSARDYSNPDAPVFKKIKLSSRRQQVIF